MLSAHIQRDYKQDSELRARPEVSKIPVRSHSLDPEEIHSHKRSGWPAKNTMDVGIVEGELYECSGTHISISLRSYTPTEQKGQSCGWVDFADSPSTPEKRVYDGGIKYLLVWMQSIDQTGEIPNLLASFTHKTPYCWEARVANCDQVNRLFSWTVDVGQRWLGTGKLRISWSIWSSVPYEGELVLDKCRIEFDRQVAEYWYFHECPEKRCEQTVVTVM